MPYTGITQQALFLLSQNRFEDSKEFYDAHKAEIKAQVFTPLAQIMEALSDDFAGLDPQMLLSPSKMSSRVRRDTRFTKDKRMYRDNVWLMFMRPKSEPMLWPIMWFEIKPEEGWSAGVCVYDQTPKYMQFLRERFDEDFLAAADCAISAGAELEIEAFKKERVSDCPENLKPYRNAKNFFLLHNSNDMELLARAELVGRLRALYQAYHPMYRWLQAAAEEFLTEALI